MLLDEHALNDVPVPFIWLTEHPTLGRAADRQARPRRRMTLSRVGGRPTLADTARTSTTESTPVMRAPTIRTTFNTMKRRAGPANIALTKHPRPYPVRTTGGRVKQQIRRAFNPRARRAFSPLIDAKAASTILGVPYTWLLAQARAGTIPHHRLGHYVRFNPDDLVEWLKDTKIEPGVAYPSNPRPQ